MKALCWHGKKDVRCDTVPDPTIEDPRDAIVKVSSCAICGSDLHLFDGFMPGMKSGDILGHEFMGEVVEVGSASHKLKVGDRVLFGKDTYNQDEYHTYFRVLETADEYFDYYRKRHAHWKIYGLDLPDAVLRKVYYRNALTLFPSIDRSLFPAEP